LLALMVVIAVGQLIADEEKTPTSELATGVGGRTPEYTMRRWTVTDGLPSNSIQCLLQTHDGYLWIGTHHGLLRFNGLEFRTFSDIDCLSLAEDSDGTLWIGCSDKLIRWDRIEPRIYRLPSDFPPDINQSAVSICPGREGGVWIGWSEGLWRAKGDSLNRIGRWLGTAAALSIHENHDHRLLVAGRAGLRLWAPNRASSFENCPVVHTDAVRCALEDDESRLWFGGWPGAGVALRCLSGGIIRDYTAKIGSLASLAQGPFREIWLGTTRGLWELSNDRILRPSGLDGAELGVINTLLTDREGDLWGGTDENGLFRLKPRSFRSYTEKDGLPDNDIRSVTRSHDGSLWIATRAGASLLRAGTFVNYQAKGSDREDDKRSNDLHVIMEDRSGSVWASGSAGLRYLAFDEFVPIHHRGSWDYEILSSDSMDPGSPLCFGGGPLTVFERYMTQPGASVTSTYLRGGTLLGLLKDRAGNLWAGTCGADLYSLRGPFLIAVQDHVGNLRVWPSPDRLTSDRVEMVAHFSTDNGLPSNLVAPVLADPDGTIWLASDKGLGRIRKGVITAYTTAQGLPEQVVWNVLEDNFGWLWLNGPGGIHRVSRRSLGDVGKGKQQPLECMSYGLEDGLPSLHVNGGGYPNSCRGDDSHLWFPSDKGLAEIDPRLAQIHALPPRVVIESMRADGDLVYDNAAWSLGGLTPIDLAETEAKRYGSPTAKPPVGRTELRLRPGHGGSLLFHFAANVLSGSDRVRFRYRLAEGDPGWIDLGPQSYAPLNHLPPGHYRFQVTACNPHGIWNPTGAELAFYLPPVFYRTWIFYGLCAGIAMLGIGAFEAYRQSVRRRMHTLENHAAVAQERERIARDLHDDLGASLSRIALLSVMARKELEADSRAAPGIGRISVIAQEVVDMAELRRL